jgi:hypothetical protein
MADSRRRRRRRRCWSGRVIVNLGSVIVNLGAYITQMLLEWLPARYPARFSLQRERGGGDGAVTAVRTHSPGYRHEFTVSDFAEQPLKLAGMLTQEEWCATLAGSVIVNLGSTIVNPWPRGPAVDHHPLFESPAATSAMMRCQPLSHGRHGCPSLATGPVYDVCSHPSIGAQVPDARGGCAGR